MDDDITVQKVQRRGLGKVKGVIKTLRPPVGVVSFGIAGSVVFLASYINSGSLPSVSLLIWAMLATWLGTVSSYAFNDYFDIENDKVANPRRAAPLGELKGRDLVLLGLILGLGSMSICLLIFNWLFAGVGALGLFMILLYSAYFKGRTPYSFLFVTLATCLMPIAVWLAFLPLSIEPILIAGVYLFFEPGFTLAGVSRDTEGDRERNIPTLPVSIGIKGAAKFMLVCWIGVLLVCIATTLLTPLGAVFFISSLIGCLWIIYLSATLILRPESKLAGDVFIKSSLFFWIFNLGIIGDVLYQIIRF